MVLELHPPLLPMEALSVEVLPQGREWQYEPKWDGFRCLAFRDGDHVELQSKSGQSLTRYFPEIVAAVLALPVRACMLDGEIVVPQERSFSFDALLQRLHPAASRVRRLAAETPALLIVFDLLADEDGRSWSDRPLTERRKRLERFARKAFRGNDRIRLSPASTSVSDALRWTEHGAGVLDGIIAKRRDLAYQFGERGGMQKIKNYRSADCVVGGFRYNQGRPVVGSLLLGLYDDSGKLNHVGFTSTIANAAKPALTRKLEALVAPPGFTGNAPGGPSRWSGKRSTEWQPLRPKLVVEVCYDHFAGGRFRHGTRLLRWRPDKDPARCTMDQVRQQQADLLALLQ